MEKVRIDKWLWAVRICKSRTLAGDLCRDGKVKINGNSIKASYMLMIGEVVDVKKDHFNMQFKALQLIEKRVSAVLAAPCYEDLTPPEELNKFKDWFIQQQGKEYREPGIGRPTKKDRRSLDRVKGEDDV
jgi:ribosome-associated heat shock protein Hsp15